MTGPREECKAVEQAKADPNDWRAPIIKYIKKEEELDDKSTAERIAWKSAHYSVIGDALYKRGGCKCFHEVH
jgi:hypothetical protein